MTAAHCTINREPDATRVVTNAHHINSDGIIYTVQRIEVHEDYDPPYLANDISLVQTEESIVFSTTVAPIAIGTAVPIGAGIQARASGWGRTAVSKLTYLICCMFQLFVYSTEDHCQNTYSFWI